MGAFLSACKILQKNQAVRCKLFLTEYITPFLQESDQFLGAGSTNKGIKKEIEDNGNLILYNGAKLEWSVEGKGIAMLKMQNDGNLVAYDANMGAKWASNWGSNGNKIKCCNGMGDKLKLQSDGNLVVYTSGNRAAWAAK